MSVVSLHKMRAQQNLTEFKNATYCADNCNKTNYILLIVVLYAFGSVTVLFNVPSVFILIVTFCRKLELKGIHMMSLSFADALLGVTWMMSLNTLGGTKLSFINCFFRNWLYCVTFLATRFQVLGICIERIIVICLNQKIVSQQKKRISIGIIIMSWGLAILIVTIMAVVIVRSYDEDQTCSFDGLFQDQIKTAIGTMGVITALTVVAVVFTMTIVLVFLIKHQKKMNKLNVRKIKKSDINLCITIGMIAIFFFVVNSPLTVVYLLEGFYPGMPSSRIIRNASFLFAGINSMVDPFIYLFRIKYYRDLLRKSINQIRSCSSVHPQSM